MPVQAFHGSQIVTGSGPPDAEEAPACSGRYKVSACSRCSLHPLALADPPYAVGTGSNVQEAVRRSGGDEGGVSWAIPRIGSCGRRFNGAMMD